MQQPLPTGPPALRVPSFYITGRQTIRPAAILLATVAAAVALSSVLYALEHSKHLPFKSDSSGAARSANIPSEAAADDTKDDKDDPDQIDTIVLGDPADAPVPARKGDHVSPVHPTILVHLPRFGDQVGLIPNSPAGHLLYDWLADVNRPHNSAPSNAPHSNADPAQMELRRLTGGFTLLSAKEVQPGVIVFRLRAQIQDQTAAATEVLGTLQMRPDSNPAAIASFSLRSVSPQ
jgi:hypothetical protein